MSQCTCDSAHLGLIHITHMHIQKVGVKQLVLSICLSVCLSVEALQCMELNDC